MLTPTNYCIGKKELQIARDNIENFVDIKTSINEPTGNFFYSEWQIKTKFKDTIWEQILNSLPKNIGEARLIKLESGKCYLQHADIDDRYHLNIAGENSYLVDLDEQQLHLLDNDGRWYEMNAGKLHSAINLGRDDRYQLVVRKLLHSTNLNNPVKIVIQPKQNASRFLFDNQISPILNYLNKNSLISDFDTKKDQVEFNIESEFTNIMQKLSTDYWLITYD